MAKAAGTSGPSSSQKASSSIWPTILLVTAVFGAMLSFLVFNNPFKLDFNLTEKQPEKTDYPGRARSVLRSTPLIDGHNDFPFLLRLDLKNQIYGTDFEKLHSQSQTDLFKMREGMMGGQFWSVWVPCPGQLDPGMEKHDMNFSNPLGDGTKKVPGLHDPNWSVRDTLEQIDLTKRFVAQYPNHLQLCTEPLCVRSAHRAGKVASMIGIEGGHQTGNSLGALRLMFDMGARYVTVTHNCDNAYATAWSSVDKTKTGRDADPGLTDFGRELVQEMNRLGMLVDISHVSANAMRDVLDVAQAPVIFSHSGAYGVHPMGRNVPDDVLRRLKKNGGVVMVPTISFFLRDKNPEEATVEDVVDHIMHIAEVAGWEHVGIGSDFDGSTAVAKGIEDTTQYPNLVARVLARGATDEQAKLLVGDNVLRAWTEAEKVAKKLQVKGELPNEAYYEGRLWEPDIGDIVPHVLPQND